MTKYFDSNIVPIDADTLESILSRVKGVTQLWQAQEISKTYLDFPDSFPIRAEYGELLGHLIWDEATEWIFHPATLGAQEQDRASKQPGPPPL